MVKRELKTVKLEEQFNNKKREGNFSSLKPYFKYLTLSESSKNFEGSSKSLLISSNAALEGIYSGNTAFLSQDFKKLSEGVASGLKIACLPDESDLKTDLLSNLIGATLISLIGLTFLAIEEAKPDEDEYPSNMDIYPELISRMYFRSDIPFSYLESMLEALGSNSIRAEKGARGLEGLLIIFILTAFAKEAAEFIEAMQAKLEASFKALDEILPADFVEIKAVIAQMRRAIDAKNYNLLTKGVQDLSQRYGINQQNIRNDIQNIKRLYQNLKTYIVEGLEKKSNVVTFIG